MSRTTMSIPIYLYMPVSTSTDLYTYICLSFEYWGEVPLHALSVCLLAIKANYLFHTAYLNGYLNVFLHKFSLTAPRFGVLESLL